MLAFEGSSYETRDSIGSFKECWLILMDRRLLFILRGTVYVSEFYLNLEDLNCKCEYVWVIFYYTYISHLMHIDEFYITASLKFQVSLSLDYMQSQKKIKVVRNICFSFSLVGTTVTLNCQLDEI